MRKMLSDEKTGVGFGFTEGEGLKGCSDARPDGITGRRFTGGIFFLLITWMICLLSIPAGAATVKLCYQNGKTYKTLEVSGKERFPAVKLKASTFNGWGPAQTVHKGAVYTPGQRIPNVDAVYYMIGNSNTEVKVLRAARMKKTKKYSQVFLVGDSRTMQMYLTIRKMLKSTTFVYGNGGGLLWFKQTGYASLLGKVRAQSSRSRKKSAVVLNLGVNDLWNVKNYVAFYKQISGELSRYNCELFIMSVNPIDVVRMRDGGRHLAKNAYSVITFNRKLKKGVGKAYTWVDTYSKLLESGFTTQGSVYDGGGDGVHYTKATYQRIYNFLIGEIG